MVTLIINARMNGRAVVEVNYTKPLNVEIDTEDLKERVADGVAFVMDEMRKRGCDVREYFIAISYE